MESRNTNTNVWKIVKPDKESLEIYLNEAHAERIWFHVSDNYGACATEWMPTVAYFLVESASNSASLPDQYFLPNPIIIEGKLTEVKCTCA